MSETMPKDEQWIMEWRHHDGSGGGVLPLILNAFEKKLILDVFSIVSQGVVIKWVRVETNAGRPLCLKMMVE